VCIVIYTHSSVRNGFLLNKCQNVNGQKANMNNDMDFELVDNVAF